MPLIPSIAGSNPLPKVPGAVLDRERRPTVNNGPLAAAVNRLGESGRRPDVPNALAAPLGALSSIGDSLIQAGDVVSGIAAHEQDSKSRIQIGRADDALNAKFDEFEAWRASNPDPLTWDAKWQEMTKGTIEGLLSDKTLTPQARDEISLRAPRALSRQTGSVRVSTQQAIFAEEKKRALGEMQNAINAQDPAKFEETLKFKGFPDYEKEAFRKEFKDTGERLQKKAKADAFEKAENDVTNLAGSRGSATAFEFIDKSALDATEKDLLKQKARIVEARTRGDLADRVLNGIIAGDVKSPARIDELVGTNPLMDEQTKAKLKTFLAEKDDNAIKADREQNGVKNAVSLTQAAKDYDRKSDPKDEKYLSLRWEIAQRVPEGLRNAVLDTLEAKHEGKTIPLPPGSEGYLKSTLDVIYDESTGVIPWKRAVNSLDAKGRPIPDQNERGGYKLEWFEDMQARQTMIDARAKVEIEVRKWMQDNPQATPEQIKEQINKVLPEGTRKRALETMQKLKTAGLGTGGTVTSYGYANDETPDSNSSAGIGAFVPKEEQEKIKAGLPSEFKLREGDIAVSPDVEKEFRAQGVKPGDTVMVRLANGEVRPARWMDRTAQDSDITSGRIKGVSKVLRGRFDFYSPRGRSKLDGMKVVGWSKPESLFAGN